MNTIVVKPIPPKDAPEIVQFIKSDFCKNEPCCYSLGGLDSKAFDFWVHRVVECGLSFEAIDTAAENKRVGVLLCTTEKKGEINPVSAELSEFKMDEKLERIYKVMSKAYPIVQEEVFERRKKTFYFEGVFLSVLTDCAGRGIANYLLEAAEVKSMQMGIDVIFVLCSSEFSSRACLKRGFELFNTVPYTTIPVKAPHVGVKSMLKWL